MDTEHGLPRASKRSGVMPGASTNSRTAGTRPGLYALILVSALYATLAYKLRTEGVFACPAGGFGGDRYVAYCNAQGFGDYDRGAFWFGLEPRIRDNAAAADVLFIGNSRMQFAFSANATSDWFSANRARHFLLGFSHTENVVFTGPLLADLKPRARAYVVNVDRFFDDTVTHPTGQILRDSDVQSRYREKQFWQSLHRPLCGVAPVFCGHRLSFVRHREDGSWKLGGTGPLTATGIGDGPAIDQEKWSGYAAIAREFVSKLPVAGGCVILTIAPYAETKIDEARAIADSLGIPLLSPRLEGLRTFDASHLDRPSAERWSAAFFDIAGPRLRACLSGSGVR